MKRLTIPALILVTLILGACGQSAGRLNNAGNEAFDNREYDEALVAYSQAAQESPELAEPLYNAANTHYRLEDYENALAQIEAALVSEKGDRGLNQKSFFNLGNTLFQSQQFGTAVEAFKEALRLNPDDLEAKQNLELALRQLQQQEQQDQRSEDVQQQDQRQDQQQDDQEQNEEQQNQQPDQQQEGRQQNDEQQDQQDEQQQNSEQNKQSQDQQQDQQDEQQDQEQEQQNSEGQRQDAQNQQGAQPSDQPQQVEGLTEEQARQLFEAAARDTKSLEQFLQQIYVFPVAPPAEDW